MEFPCPCCGFLVFREPPGSEAICPVCAWQDDVSQLRFPGIGGGTNLLSLFEAQKEFHKHDSFGTVGSFQKESGWRPLDENTDGEIILDLGEGEISYPEDMTKLYYWR